MTTLEDTMERLGIPPEAADTAVKNNIIRLINSASAWIETITGRKFGKATYTHRYVAPGTQELVLTQYPIRAVEYVRELRWIHYCPRQSLVALRCMARSINRR